MLLTTFCSFYEGSPEILEAILKYPIISTLMANLHPNLPQPILISSLRTLITVLQVRPNPNVIASHPQVVATLEHIISSPNTPLTLLDLSCKLIPLLAPSKPHYLQGLTGSLILKISTLMNHVSHYTSTSRTPVRVPLDSALFALAHIIDKEQALQLLSTNSAQPTGSGRATIDSQDFLDSLLSLTRSSDTGVRVAVVSLLVKIQSFSLDPNQIRKLTRPLLPTLVPLLDLPEKDPRVYRTLAIVCRDDPEVVKMAVEANIINKVRAIINTADTVNWSDSELISSCLLVLVAISMRDEPYRIEIMDTGILSNIVQFMSSKSENPISISAFGLRKVKLASSHLLRTLGHSVTLLRTGLATPEVVDGIYSLLVTDPNDIVTTYKNTYGADALAEEVREQLLEEELEVKSAVMAAVCNIVPEFSSLQEIMVKKGFLDLIVEGTRSSYPPLRLNSVWALKHAISALSAETRAQLLSGMTTEHLVNLCNDVEPQVQEQALGVIRNIACSGDMDAINFVLDGIGFDNFFDMLNEKITASMENATYAPDQPHHNLIIVQVVYIISNIVIHTETLKDKLLKREDVLKKLLPLFNHNVMDIRNGCAWIVINLTWQEDHTAHDLKEGCQARAQQLIRLGFKEKLNDNKNDPCLDVRERTKTALFQLEELVSGGTRSMLH